MTSDLRQCSRDFLADFIKIYQSFPCLWQVKNKDYRNRNKKNAAYQKLVEKYREVDPLADRATITKKINSLRSVYRKELVKVQKSENSGDQGEVYKPSLWYYELFNFLDDQDVLLITPQETLNDEEDDYVLMEQRVEEDVESVTYSPTPDEHLDDTNHYSASSSTISKGSARKRRPTAQQVLKVLSRAEKRLETTSEDSLDRYGRHITDRLRQIEPNQMKFVQKLISDVLFEAEMENLDKHWKLVKTQLTQVPQYQAMQPSATANASYQNVSDSMQDIVIESVIMKN